MTNDIPRYCPARSLPPYSYVPGLAPHPTSDPRGHSFGHHEPRAQALDESSFHENATYLYAIDLFNHGFYWEAHEAWEALWHAAGRRGATADFLKGLIKLAAAGVKAREGRAAGIRQHAERAGELFGAVAAKSHAHASVDMAPEGKMFGLRLRTLIAEAEELASQAERLAGGGSPDARRMLPTVLRLSQ